VPATWNYFAGKKEKMPANIYAKTGRQKGSCAGKYAQCAGKQVLPPLYRIFCLRHDAVTITTVARQGVCGFVFT
jgi:hypothetical protein